MPSIDTNGSDADHPPPSGIPSILFNSTLRLFLIRSILVAGTFAMSFEIYLKDVVAAVFFGVTVLHHLLR